MAKNKTERFNIETAYNMAEEYLKMANYSHTIADQKNKDENSAYIALSISNYAFALEIYLKSILFLTTEKVYHGHDLAKLWSRLQPSIRDWISDVFKQNYDIENKDWAALVIIAPQKADWRNNVKFKTGKNTATGMIKSHRIAFEHGRYAYEQPAGGQIKSIVHNLNGLKLMSQLVREVAKHFSSSIQEKSKSYNLKEGEKVTFEVDFPTTISSMPRF